VAFFALCAAVFIRQLFDTRPRILIDDQGLTDRTIGAGLIAWSDGLVCASLLFSLCPPRIFFLLPE
jgi:hypothetical protein